MSAATRPGPIRFGTSGWRGILGDELHDRRVAAAVTGVAAWLGATRAVGPVLVAHDRRFGGARWAALAAAVLRARGRVVRVAREPAPTPALARAVRREGAAAALVFTASHNAAWDHGLKVLDGRGASAAPAVTGVIERAAAEALASSLEPPASRVERGVDLLGPYRADLRGALSGSLDGLGVAYDAMHGAAAGVLDAVLREAGARLRVLRVEPDLRFGGSAPDPTPARLAALRRTVASDPRCALGLASDGDGDRYAVVDEAGRCISESQALALLVDHLARSGRVRAGVAISLATGSLVERVARHHGMTVERYPIGFKHMADALAAGTVDVAGEESGGFALGVFSLDKDGMLAGTLLAEMATREPLGRTLRRLERRFGRLASGRRALPADPVASESLERLRERPPQRLASGAVRAVDVRDGLRLELEDGFLMLRRSGTEGVLRVYAEAPSARGLARRLGEGERLLRARGHGCPGRILSTAKG